MKHESKQREKYDCPLSVCPRTFDTEQSAEDHCKSVRRIAPETISEFNRNYEKREDSRRISQDEHYQRYRAELHVHHVVPRREFTSDDGADWEQANQLSDLVTLCNSCRPKHEEKPSAFFESVTQSA